MWLKNALISLVLLICPCALCYGQLSFSGVNGERGYSAMRGFYRADLDNGFVFTPHYEYYRQTDKEYDESGTISRYKLTGSYELNDDWSLTAAAFWQPTAVGYRAVGYGAGAEWKPFYRWGLIKNPVLAVWAGQERYKVYVDRMGNALADSFHQIATSAAVQARTELASWDLIASWHKVIQYKNNNFPPDVTFGWADIPYMTAVIQGFIKDAAAVRVSYRTNFITPYMALGRYNYAERRGTALSLSAGMRVNWGRTALTGGVEVFEPRREANRKTYFSMSAEVDF